MTHCGFYRPLPLLLALVAGPLAFGQQPAPTPARAGGRGGDVSVIVTRVYDIADLLMIKRDYPAPEAYSSGRAYRGGGGGGGGGGALFSQPQPTTNPNPIDERADILVRLIKDTVATDSWRDNGGSVGAIRLLDKQLIVTQSSGTQSQVAELLKELRQQQSSMIVVRAYWLMFEPGAVASLSSSGGSLPIVDDKLIDAKHLYCAAQTICMNGQTTYVMSGHSQNQIVDITPVVAAGATSIDPSVEAVRSGIVLQITPQLTGEDQNASVVLDLQNSMTELDPAESKAHLPPSSPPNNIENNGIDRVNKTSQEFHTTARLPLRKKVLISGMTLEPTTKDLGSQQLYLVIEADAVK